MEAREEKLNMELYVNKFFDRLRNDFNDMYVIKYYIPIVVIAAYLLTLWVGTRWMKNRPAFELKTVLRIYNLIQVVLNLTLISPLILIPDSISIIWKYSCKLTSEDVDNLISDAYMFERNLYYLYHWLYLMVKMIDLLDTVFMVLLKKKSHITFLHVYHHVSMVFFTWFTLKHAPGVQGMVIGAVNTFVHVIMYSYFFLSTFGPSVQKFLWWKQHLTKLQMVQFVAVLTFILLLVFNGCPLSRTFINIWIFNVGVILCLFCNFYIQTYIKKPNAVTKDAKNK